MEKIQQIKEKLERIKYIANNPESAHEFTVWETALYGIELLSKEALSLIDKMEKEKKSDPLGEALNSGDGTHRP